MAESNSTPLRAAAWSELFPWLSIARAFRLAIAVRSLILGAMGILLTVLVWGVIGLTFGTDEPATEWLRPFTANPWTELTKDVPNQPRLLGASDVTIAEIASSNPVTKSWNLLNSPAMETLSRTGISLRSLACLVLCGLWGMAVWAFFGAAICRTAAIRLGADEQIGVGAALRYASRKWPSYFAAPLLPVVAVAFATCLILVLGWIMRYDVGLAVGGILWPLVLVAGFLMAVVLLGLLFGWPLMWGAISVEGTDSFDALSRSYAYVFQRPLRYLFYLVVAGVIGWLGWIVVQEFAAGVIWLGYWAAGWGCGQDTITSILNPGGEVSDVRGAGVWLIRFWTGCVKMLAVGYAFSYFWTASTAVYYLLRYDVDATEMDEVFLDADAAEQAPPLPSAVENGSDADNGDPAESK
jgi:hypothetical protein